MWWVEQYRSNESDERAEGMFISPELESRISDIEKNPKLYNVELQKGMTDREGAITELFENNKKSKELLATLFPDMSEKWNVVINNGKLPGMNPDWEVAKNPDNVSFIRGTADIKVEDIDTPNDVDNLTNQIEQIDRT